MKSLVGAFFLVFFLGMTSVEIASAQATILPWSQQAANAAIVRWPDGRFVPSGAHWAWNYELGTLLEGMDAVWLKTADPRYYDYIQRSVDQFVGLDGSIPSLKPEENQLDNILLGRQLLLLYETTKNERYAKAATLLYQQLLRQPRSPSGGFWHKQRYPNQMWLDGLYMAEPFYAEYASTFHNPDAFSDITHQFVLLEVHARDKRTGLLYHGWDESRQQRWADKKTGLSSQFWARGMGWHMMALVDVLGYYPENDAGKKLLITQLQMDAAAITRFQDVPTGLWYQVLDKPDRKGNFQELSASCMFVYALTKGVRLGYLPLSYLSNAERGYQGILKHFIQIGSDGMPSLTGTVKAAGLGGYPYRDGSYAYYISEKQSTDDPKGVGAFLLACVEIENRMNLKNDRDGSALHDKWNSIRKNRNAVGYYAADHYKWSDQNESEYSFLGHYFNNSREAAIKLDCISQQHVLGDFIKMGMLSVIGTRLISQHLHTQFMKDKSSIFIDTPQFFVFKNEEKVIFILTNYGNGTGFAVADPWPYNKYLDGRILRGKNDNYATRTELVRWIVSQIPHKKISEQPENLKQLKG
jgi:unsaturated rhamnogalacturonyl hydrolase